MQISIATVESSMEILQKAIELPYDPVVVLLGIYPEEYQDTIETPVYQCSSQCYSQ
jgi:hypothetical protein